LLSVKDEAAAAHCATLVRDRNRPRFVASLFAPAETRRKLLALYALDAELERISEVAREAMIKAMRFQWWRDALAALPDVTRGHPVLEELAGIGGAEAAALQGVVDARENPALARPAEACIVAMAARLCGAAPGENELAERIGSAIAAQDASALAGARETWRAVRHTRRAELPAYLPASVIDMKHPVTALRLYGRMLVKGLGNRF